MRRFTVIFLIISSTSIFSQISLANNAINAIKNNDRESLRKLYINRNVLNNVSDKYVSESRYNELLSNRISSSFRSFENIYHSIKSYEIVKISKPTREYKWKGYLLINFYVILKNKYDDYIKVLFNDCSKINGEYYLSESIQVKNN